MKIEVFDPAMCCSTGVCGPSVDPALARFAADLDIITSRGVAVRRFNLGQEPLAFAQNDHVRELLTTRGETALPMVFTEGELRSVGRFPTLDELADWCQVRVGIVPIGSVSGFAPEAAKCCSPADATVTDATDCCASAESATSDEKSDASAPCC